MDMKRILQAMDGASSKPVEGVDSMSKFLSIINEGSNPHKVTLPVQMAMQHYQQPVVGQPITTPVSNITRESSIRKYFDQAETDATKRLTQKNTMYKQYAQTIAERVLMRESTQRIKEGADLSGFDTEWLRKASDPNRLGRYMVSVADAQAELTAREQGKQPVVPSAAPTPAPTGYSKEWLEKAADPNRLGRYMISIEKAQELLKTMQEGLSDNMGFKPGPGGPGLQGNVAETPLDFDRENPMSSTIHSHKGANPGSIEYRIMRARRQLKDLAEQAQSDDPRIWQHITKLFPELAMNIEQISHGLGELGAKRRAGGSNSRNIPAGIDEMMNDPCWKGYKMVGTKKKGSKSVPNCVPNKGK